MSNNTSNAERVDLFGAPVAPTVEQGTLFAPHVGAAVPTMRDVITAAEMTARRDDLGAEHRPEPTDNLDALDDDEPGDECAECGAEFDEYRRGGAARRCLDCGTVEKIVR